MSTIFPAISHYPITNPAGVNQQITYASNGQVATSHRVDVNGTSNPAQEATVYLSWPANCTGGGHPELAIKHWGPSHTDSSCCYIYGSAVPIGPSLHLGSGGEGPHPTTQTIQQLYTSIPFAPGKLYGFKSIVWPRVGGGAHHELHYDVGTGWIKAGQRDVAAIGVQRTSTTIAPGAQVEFRIDCANVVFQRTDVAAINPSGPRPPLVKVGTINTNAPVSARPWKRTCSSHTIISC